MRRIASTLFGLLVLAACGTVSAATPVRTIVLVADVWCPVSCRSAAEQPGYAVEAARAAFALSGWQVEYRVVPWQRAIDAVRAGRIDGIIGTIVANTPDFVFPKESIGDNVNVFFAPVGTAWRYRGLHTLDDVVVGVANEYKFDDPFDNYVVRHARDPRRLAIIYSQDPVRQGLDMLAAGRIGAYLDDRMVVNWAMRQQAPAVQLREVGELNRTTLFIAFSPSRQDAKETAAVFDEGMRTLRADGRLAAILARYGIRDWGPARLKAAEVPGAAIKPSP